MKQNRKKISTTISPQGYAVLEKMIAAGKAKNLAEAIDLVLEEIRRDENRAHLERMMAEYYDNPSREAVAEENEIAEAFSRSASEINLDE
ncbi:MAG: hypothetical protein WBQ34_07710 [Candidatus Acidiferrales bacterium]